MPDPGEIAAIVLAAGASYRFGADKLLHPLTRKGMTLPLAAHSLLPWLDTFGVITVVVRPDSGVFCKTIDAALGRQLRYVVCADAGRGMAASLAAGVRANLEAAGWLIGLADMPCVPSSAISGVKNLLLAGAALAAPFCEGKRGHPVGFAAAYRTALLNLQGDHGARQILANRHGASSIPVHESACAGRLPHPNPLPEGEGTNKSLRDFHGNDEITPFKINDEGIFTDIDTADDLQRL